MNLIMLQVCGLNTLTDDVPFQVKLNLSLLEGINNDMEFCLRLANEESVVVLPGMIL